MSMDLTDVIDEFASDTLSIQRVGASVLTAGFWVTPAAVALSVEAVVYPASGEDIMILPEGHRSEKIIAVASRTKLRTADDPDGVHADTFAYKGETFEVQTVRDWGDQGNYYWHLAVKVGG